MPQEHEIYRVKTLYLTLYQNKPFQRFNATIWRARISITCSQQSEVPPKVAPTHSCWLTYNSNMEAITVKVNICLLSSFMPESGNWLKVCVSLSRDPIYLFYYLTFRRPALALEIANTPGIHWIAVLCTSASGISLLCWQKQSSQVEAAPQSWRETLVREVSRRGMLAAAPAAAAGFLCMISFWRQPMLSVTCLQKRKKTNDQTFPLLNEWFPCPGKWKQIKKITVLPTMQAFWWGFGGLEGDASALPVTPPW